MEDLGESIFRVEAMDQGFAETLDDISTAMQNMAHDQEQFNDEALDAYERTAKAVEALVEQMRPVEPLVEEMTDEMSKASKTSKDLGKNMQDAGEKTNKAGRFFQGFGTLVSKAFNIAKWAILAVVGAAGSLGAIAVKLAADAGEIDSKFNVVFGESAERASKNLEEFGKRVGRSRMDLKAMAGDMQSLLVPLGFMEGQASDMSVALTKLAVDLGSFNNSDPTEVMNNLQSALIGNTEGVRKYGAIITETTLNAKLMAMGVAGGTEAASEQQKVLARLQMIMEATTRAQGDATNTSGSFANQSKALLADLKDLGVTVGQALLPALGLITGEIRGMTAWFANQEGTIMDWGETLKSYVSQGIEWLKTIVKVVMNVGLAWDTLVLTVAEAIAPMVSHVEAFAQNSWIAVSWFFENFSELSTLVYQNYIQILGNLAMESGAIWDEIWGYIKSGGQDAVEINTQALLEGVRTLKGPEFVSAMRADFSQDWENNRKAWDKVMGAQAAAAVETGKTVNDALDINSIFAGLDAAKNKASDVKAEFVGVQELFRRNILANFQEDENKKQTAELVEANKLQQQQIAQEQKQHTELVQAVKASSVLGP